MYYFMRKKGGGQVRPVCGIHIEYSKQRKAGVTMEREFPMKGGGALLLREEGGKALCTAQRPNDHRGLYKVYLCAARGEMSLGAMVPEGGTLRLSRALDCERLMRGGCWPVTGARAELSFCASRSEIPPGWSSADPASALFPKDALLRRTAAQLGGALLRRGKKGFLLAVPYEERMPFAMTPLFCFAEIHRLGGSAYAVFSFREPGIPIMPHKGKKEGDTTF